MRRFDYWMGRFAIFTHQDEFQLGMLVLALGGLLWWWAT